MRFRTKPNLAHLLIKVFQFPMTTRMGGKHRLNSSHLPTYHFNLTASCLLLLASNMSLLTNAITSLLA